MPPAASAGLIEIEVEVVDLVLLFLSLVLVVEAVLVPVVVWSLAVLVSLEVSLAVPVDVWEATEVVCSEVDAEEVEESLESFYRVRIVSTMHYSMEHTCSLVHAMTEDFSVVGH